MGIQIFYPPFCQILSLSQGLDTMGDWNQHARVLSWHHKQQKPQPQEL